MDDGAPLKLSRGVHRQDGPYLASGLPGSAVAACAAAPFYSATIFAVRIRSESTRYTTSWPGASQCQI